MTTSQDEFKMTAPSVEGQGKEKNVTEMLPSGNHPCYLFNMIDLGHQWNKSDFKEDGWQRQLLLIYEFPLEQRTFYDDIGPQPIVISPRAFNYLVVEKSNLKKWIDQSIGRVLQPSEYPKGQWNIGQLLGRAYLANITHNPDKKDPSKVWANIGTIAPLTKRDTEVMNLPWKDFKQINPVIGFSVDTEGKCFTSEKFGELYRWIQDLLKNSKEGKEFAQRGGKFYEKPKEDNEKSGDNQPLAFGNDSDDIPNEEMPDPNSFI